jgi:hypothetical protein
MVLIELIALVLGFMIIGGAVGCGSKRTLLC